jgi:glycosyltransferase involved in cell wall biosynthesis
MTNGLADVRVALVHYWLVSHRGGERVLEVLGDMFPQADIYTLVYDPAQSSQSIKRHRIHPSFLQSLPFARKAYQWFLPLFPIALEQFDLRDYDLVISQESGPAKGVLTNPETCHICYCHSPMRYAWNMYHDYLLGAGWPKRILIPPLMKSIRQWDQMTAARVDYFVASSRNGSKRIRKYYRREAPVIYPPVDLSLFSVAGRPEDFYLVVSPLVAYKRVDLAVAACSKLNRRLVVIGSGAELGRLRHMAGPSITFLGPQPDEVVRDHFRRCRAFLFPGEEDIGLTPIEAQACGRPVIAYAKGGALETVIGYSQNNSSEPEACTGLFFPSQSVESTIEAIQMFESIEARFDPRLIRAQAERFDLPRFRAEMQAFITEKLAEFRHDSQSANPKQVGPGTTASPWR